MLNNMPMTPEALDTEIDVKIKNGYRDNCTICTHQASKEAVFIYFEADQQVDQVKKWFQEVHNQEFMTKSLQTHFTKHVDPYITKDEIQKYKRYTGIVQIARNNTNEDKLTIFREMLWEFVKDIYAFKPQSITNPLDYKKHQEMAKTMLDLTKGIMNITQTQISMLGVGKSEDDIRGMMQSYMKEYGKNLLSILEEHPEAQKLLALRMGLEVPANVIPVNDEDFKVNIV